MHVCEVLYACFVFVYMIVIVYVTHLHNMVTPTTAFASLRQHTTHTTLGTYPMLTHLGTYPCSSIFVYMRTFVSVVLSHPRAAWMFSRL